MTDIEFITSDKVIKHLHPSKIDVCLDHLRSNPRTAHALQQRKKYPIRIAIYQFLGLDKLGAGATVGKIEFWTLRGWPKEEAEYKKSERYAKVDNRTSSPYSRTAKQYVGLSEEEITNKINCSRPTSVEYWVKKGFSPEEAANKLANFQKYSANISTNKHKHRTERTISQIGYWLKLGYTSEEARIKTAEVQDTKSLKSCVTHRGILSGARKYLQAIKRYYKNNQLRVQAVLLTYLEFRKNRTLTSHHFLERVAIITKELNTRAKGHASQESLIFFAPIYEELKTKFKCYIGAFGQKEFKLKRTDIKSADKFFRYDFCIFELKLIFEYDGAFFHGEHSEQNDNLKTALAESSGFKLIRLFGLSNFKRENVEFHNNIEIIKSELGNLVSSVKWDIKHKTFYDKEYNKLFYRQQNRNS